MGYLAAAIGEQALESVMSGDPEEMLELLESGIDLDKMWNAAQVVIAGSLDAQEPLMTGLPIGPDMGYGPAHYASPADVQRVAATLEALTEAELRRRFNPEQMIEQMVYPQIWDEDPESLAAEVASAAMELVELYRAAAVAGDGVLAAIT